LLTTSISKAHHDHCDPDDLPRAVEDGFHDLESLIGCGDVCPLFPRYFLL
jgi:hypothetical protein